MTGTDPAHWPQVIAFLAGAAIFAVAFLSSLLRHRDLHGERDRIVAPKSLAGLAIQILSFAAVAFGHFAVAPSVGAVDWLLAAGILALMLGATLTFLWAKHSLGRNWSLTARTRADHRLVTTGPFAVVRHPIYVALFVFMVALALTAGHLPALAIGAAVYAVGTWLRVVEEERLLDDAFGADHEAYAARVARFLPGLF